MGERNKALYTTPDLALVASNYQPVRPLETLDEHVHRYSTIFEKLLEVENPFSYFFMLNFTTMQYAYVSKSVRNVIGYSPQDFLDGGMDFAFNVVHPADKPVLRQLHARIFQYFYSYAEDERKQLKFTFDLRVRKPQGIYVRILQQSVFLELTHTGAPLLDFSTVTDITPFKKDNRLTLAIYKLSADYQHQLLHQEDFFHSNLLFTQRQLQILELVSKGLTSKEIAEALYLSIDTVKNHRKKILEVSGAKNIAEAVKIGFG